MKPIHEYKIYSARFLHTNIQMHFTINFVSESDRQRHKLFIVPNKCCETGPAVYSSYSRKSNQMSDNITKA